MQAAAQVLVANGANVNAGNSDMDTPLLLAVKGNHYSVASFLVKQVDQEVVISFWDERGIATQQWLVVT